MVTKIIARIDNLWRHVFTIRRIHHRFSLLRRRRFGNHFSFVVFSLYRIFRLS